MYIEFLEHPLHILFYLTRTRIGNFRTVLISDYQAAKEAYGSLLFVDRPEMFNLFNINPKEPGG